MSAGPLEALVELKRFFDIKSDSDTHFGSILTSKGISSDNITFLSKNSDVTVGEKTISAFDATEENDSETAATKLVTALKTKKDSSL